ncbi:oligosaccharide flippase family protein, partial [bacterium]|nr:oligosaccharide flippase family protein [bacterium]
MGEATGQKLRSMLGDAAYVALGSYGTQALSFLINVVLVRKLDLDNYGAYSVFLTVYSMSTLVMSLGAAPIVLRYLPELIARGNRGGVIR